MPHDKLCTQVFGSSEFHREEKPQTSYSRAFGSNSPCYIQLTLKYFRKKGLICWVYFLKLMQFACVKTFSALKAFILKCTISTNSFNKHKQWYFLKVCEVQTLFWLTSVNIYLHWAQCVPPLLLCRDKADELRIQRNLPFNFFLFFPEPSSQTPSNIP